MAVLKRLKQGAVVSNFAVLVIDVQIALVTGAHKENEILAAINQVITTTRDRKGVVVFIQHCHSTYEALKKGSPGWSVHPSLHSVNGDIYVEKEASDSFYMTDLDGALRANDVDHVVVTGLQTEYCVDTTCRSALSKGYAVILISDAHTTGDAHLPAQDVIDHHNEILANVAHPVQNIKVVGHQEWAVT